MILAFLERLLFPMGDCVAFLQHARGEVRTLAWPLVLFRTLFSAGILWQVARMREIPPVESNLHFRDPSVACCRHSSTLLIHGETI